MSKIGFNILQWKRKKGDRWSKCSISFIITKYRGWGCGRVILLFFSTFVYAWEFSWHFYIKKPLRYIAYQYRWGSIDGTENFCERNYCWSQMLGSLLGLKMTTSSVFQKSFYPSFSKEGSNINLYTILGCGIYINKMPLLMLAWN